MRVCGVIAEYDPLHSGHAWHLEQAGSAAQADAMVCVMSACFTQRGMPALLSAHTRAEMALRAGADIVLGLPFSFSVCDAERFALGGVHILKQLGASALSFGVEPQSISIYESAARLLEQPTPDFQARLRQGLDGGLPFPQAQGEALAAALQIDPALLALPNTALAICYARANLRLGADLSLLPIPRSGSYHDADLHRNALPSATAVRAAALRGDWQAVQAAMPADAYKLMKDAFDAGRFHAPEALDGLLRWTLRQGGDFSHLPNLSEGLENRLAAAADALTREEMARAVKSKRYPYARVNRLLTHALVGTDARQLSPLPAYAYVLGFKKRFSGLLKASQGDGFALYPRLPAGEQGYEQQLDARAADLWALGARQPFGAIWREKPVILDD